MKKAILILAMLSCLYSAVKAQLVNGINFQAVARNAAGTVIANRKITVRMSVREGSPTGFLEYSEIKATVTNAVGLFVLVLGDPSPSTTITTGSYTGINWSTGNKYLQIEIDPTGGIDFISLGTQKIHFVPFAHYANGVAARNIAGVLSLEQGGTGTNNLIDLKVNLQLDKADNTSDIDKPISNAVQSALDTKESITNKSSNISNDGSSDTRYPSVKAVKSYADGIAARIPAPQVNADWNATGGVIQILNKPSLANVATSGDYNDLSNKPSAYYLPTASATTLGGVKIGNNIFIDANGAISASGSGLGSVTSIATDNTMTGGPITTFGTLKIDTTLISTKANVIAALLQKLSLSDLPLSVANGGTGATSASAGLSALLPSQTGNAGKFLQTDGTTVSWVTSAGSVAVPVSGENGGTGVSNAGKTITLGGNLVTVGSFVTTLTANGTTHLILPTDGTLATLTGTETFTNKTLTSPVITSPSITGTLTLPSGATGVTATAGDNSTKLATTAFVTNAVINALPDASTSAKGILQLSGDLSGTATSPSVITVGGATAANIATATGLAIAATNNNTANTIIKRDASGNFSAGTITAIVFSGSLSGNASTANTAETVTAAAQPAITSLGTLTSLNVNGTASANTFSATTLNGTLTTAAQNNITSLGTLTSLNVNGTASANTFSATTLNGTLTTAAQNNITSLGTLSSLNVTGTVTASTLSATTINGTLGTATQNNITSVGTLSSLNVSGTVTASTLSATAINGTLGTAAQNNITSVGTLTSLTVTGTATAGTLSASTINGTLGTATQNNITSVGTLSSLNVSGTVTASTLSATTLNGTIGTAAQNNITSLGTLSSLNVTGTATAGTLSASTINGTLGTDAQNSITSVGTLTGLTVSGTATISSFTTTGFVQSTNAGVLHSTALSSSNVVTALGFTPVRSNFGSFSDNTTQSASAINTATVMTLNTTDIGGYGVSLANGTQIKVDNAGIYNLEFSAQMSKSSAGASDVTIWFRKNGTDVPNSATDFNLSGNTALEVAAWNYYFDLAAGDYVEIVWSTPVLTITMEKIDTRTTPTRPSVPSLIVTMHRIN